MWRRPVGLPLTVIEKYINKIDITKSYGIPGISTRLFKDAFKVLSVELTHIINESLDQAIFPDAWAIGTITPIPKGGDSHDPGNWRPITILPLPSKIMERAVHYQLINYFEENDYLHKNQHGFRKNCSTATAIFKLSRDLHSAYDLGYSTSCIFVDYKKAFENLSHKILMEKMHVYGLSQKSIRWLNSYLENRRHVVDCNGYQSEQSHVPYGVPQGSILGPSLFVIYVNDLLYLMGENNVASIEMYADDTVLHVSDSCAIKAMGQSNAAMDMLYLWCIRNKLTINFSKTKHMLIPRNEVQEGKSEHKHINVGTFILNNVSSYHYLGIDLDKYLTFEKMAESTFSKANKKLYLLKKIRPYISCAVAHRVYKSHVLPIFDENVLCILLIIKLIMV